MMKRVKSSFSIGKVPSNIFLLFIIKIKVNNVIYYDQFCDIKLANIMIFALTKSSKLNFDIHFGQFYDIITIKYCDIAD